MPAPRNKDPNTRRGDRWGGDMGPAISNPEAYRFWRMMARKADDEGNHALAAIRRQQAEAYKGRRGW